MLSEEKREQIRENIGEDPAWYLDGPLYVSGNVMDPIERIRGRIRGMDRLQVVACWLTVENRLERGPRDQVVSMLEDRREYLEENGERDLPGRTHEELRELGEQQYEQVKDQKIGGLDRSGTYSRSRVPWPTGKERLDDSDDQEDVDQEQLDVDQEDVDQEEQEQEIDPEEHPMIQGFMQASNDTVATDGGIER